MPLHFTVIVVQLTASVFFFCFFSLGPLHYIVCYTSELHQITGVQLNLWNAKKKQICALRWWSNTCLAHGQKNQPFPPHPGMRAHLNRRAYTHTLSGPVPEEENDALFRKKAWRSEWPWLWASTEGAQLCRHRAAVSSCTLVLSLSLGIDCKALSWHGAHRGVRCTQRGRPSGQRIAQAKPLYKTLAARARVVWWF